MNVRHDLHGYPADDWQKRFVIVDQSGSACRIIFHPIMLGGAIGPIHGTTVSTSHSCVVHRSPTNMSPTFQSVYSPNLADSPTNNKEDLNILKASEIAVPQPFDKCNWKQLNDLAEHEPGSQDSCSSSILRENAKDIDALLCSDEEESTGGTPIYKKSTDETSDYGSERSVNKMELSGDEDDEVSSTESAVKLFYGDDNFRPPNRSSESRSKSGKVSCHLQVSRSLHRSNAMLKKVCRRESVKRVFDLRSIVPKGRRMNVPLCSG